MSNRRIIRLVGAGGFGLLAYVLGAGNGYAETAAQCLQIPATATPPPVTFCETATSYTFAVTGTTREYAKDAFQTQLTRALQQWFLSVGLTPPEQGNIEFWLAVPEESPQSTQARAALTWPGGALVAYLGIAPETWALTSQNIGVLGPDQSYPKNFGFTAGSLLVEAAPTATVNDVAAYLSRYGALDASAVGGNWSLYAVPPLAELSVAASINADPEHGQWVKQLEPNTVFEWIATRQRAFAFSFASP